MCQIIELNAVLRLYSANFSNLHWNTTGEEMSDAHAKISEGFVELCNKYIDPTGEMITRLGSNPLNYVEVIKLLENASKQYMVIDTNKLYNRTEIIYNSQSMLKDIVDVIVCCLESDEMKNPINAGIKSELEAMLSEFDIQYRYLNKRRIEDNNECNEEEKNSLDILDTDNNDNIPENEVCPECGNSPCTCTHEAEESYDDIPEDDEELDNLF